MLSLAECQQKMFCEMTETVKIFQHQKKGNCKKKKYIYSNVFTDIISLCTHM